MRSGGQGRPSDRHYRNTQAQDPQGAGRRHTSFLTADPGRRGSRLWTVIRPPPEMTRHFCPHFIGQSKSGPHLSGQRGRGGHNPSPCLAGREMGLFGEQHERPLHLLYYRWETEARTHGIEPPQASGRAGYGTQTLMEAQGSVCNALPWPRPPLPNNLEELNLISFSCPPSTSMSSSSQLLGGGTRYWDTTPAPLTASCSCTCLGPGTDRTAQGEVAGAGPG